MSALKPVVYDGNLMRQIAQGDTVAGAEVIPATVATNAITATGAMLFGGIMQRTTTAAGTPTIDTAANIIAAISSGLGNNGVPAGTTVRLKWIQNAAFADTLTAPANAGITVTNGVVNASSVKDFLVTVVNGTPARNAASLTTTNASAVVTGFSAADIAALSVGMVVTNAVSGLQGTTILGVNAPAGSVTLSGNANATAAAQTLNFSPVITITGLGQGLL